MDIRKKTQCTISVNSIDAIANVTVRGDIDFHEDLGTHIEDDGSPRYVCNRLNVNNGAVVKGVSINSGGIVFVSNGIMDNVFVGAGGTLNIQGGTVTNIKEVGGYVDIHSWGGNECSTTFLPYTHTLMEISGFSLTAHDGAEYTSGHIHNGTVEIYSGGKITSYTLANGYIRVYTGGTCSELVISGGGSLYPCGGNVSDVEIHSGGRMDLHSVESSGFEEGSSVCKLIEWDPCKNLNNITVSSGGCVILRHGENNFEFDISKIKFEEGARLINTVYNPAEDDDDWYDSIYSGGSFVSEYDYLQNHHPSGAIVCSKEEK